MPTPPAQDRPATPEEQAAIDALGQQINDLSDTLAEDSRRWWAELEQHKQERHQEIQKTFAPLYAQLEDLRDVIQELTRERERQRAAELERRRERRQQLLKRFGIR